MINGFLSTTNELDTFYKIIQQTRSKTKKSEMDSEVNHDINDQENILEKDPWKIVEPVADMGLTPLNLAESYQSPEFLSAMKNMCYPDFQEENKGED